MEGRKRSLQHWMLLEEHSVSIFCKEIWACIKPDPEKKDSYRPGYLVVRSSIEIIPDRDVNWENINEDGGCRALCLISSKSSIVLDLESQAFSFLSPSFEKERVQPPDRLIAIMAATVSSNINEARRVFRWHEMYLDNPFHPKGLSMMNINSLPELEFPSRKNTQFHQNVPRKCPSLSHGLDQIWLCDMIKDLSNNHRMETVATLRCSKVESKRKALQTIIQERKENQS